MTARRTWILFAALNIVIVAARADDGARLEGTWALASVRDDGTSLPPEAIRGAKAVFARGTMTLVSPDGSERTVYRIALDPSTTPKTIEITSTEGTFKGQTGRGIYELEGGVLRICQPDRPSLPQPTAFAAPKGSSLNVMVLRRVAE